MTNEAYLEAALCKNCGCLVSQEDTPDNERTLAMRENTYVRLYGHMRAFGGKTSVVAFRVVPVVDMNELTMHLLEVMHSQMVLTQSVSADYQMCLVLLVPNFCYNVLDTRINHYDKLCLVDLKQFDAAPAYCTNRKQI